MMKVLKGAISPAGRERGLAPATTGGGGRPQPAPAPSAGHLPEEGVHAKGPAGAADALPQLHGGAIYPHFQISLWIEDVSVDGHVV